MISSDNIISVKTADFSRRVLDGETTASLFVNFTNPVNNESIEFRVNGIWEEAERVSDFGWSKETRSNLVIKAALVEEKSDTDPNNSTWAVYFVKQYKSSWESQQSKNSNTNFELYKLTIDLNNTAASSLNMVYASRQSSANSVAQFEKFVDADLNNDNTIGPVFLSSTPETSDASGLKFIRDSEGTPYLYAADGKHQFFESQETKSNWTNGGWEKTVVAVEKGDPLRFIAQEAFDAAMAVSGTTRSQAFDNAVKQVVKTAFAFNNWWNTLNLDNNKGISEAEVFEAAYRTLNKQVLTDTSASFLAYKPVNFVTTNGNTYDITFAPKDWSNSVFVVYREGNYYLQGDQKIFTDKRFAVSRLSDDLSNTQQTWSEAPVSWIEKFFNQDLNGDGATKAGDDLLTIVANDVVPNVPSKYFVAKDSDGRHYVLDSSDLKSANLYRINDIWFARMQEDSANRKAGSVVVAIFEHEGKDASGTTVRNTYLLTKSFEKMGVQAETVNGYTLHTLHFNKTESGQIYSIELRNNQWLDYNYDKSKFFDVETQFDRDFNNDGQIGKGNPVIVKWVDDLIPANTAQLPKTVIATNAAGEVFIMEAASDNDALLGNKNAYSVKPVIDAIGNAARWTTSTSWESKTAYAVVKTSLQNVKTAAAGNNAWFPWGSENNTSPVMNSGVGTSLKLTDEAYFVAVKNVSNSTNVSWQIFLVNTDGKFDPNSLYVNRISTIESVFQQDLNGDQQVGTPVPKEIEGPSKLKEFYSTDSVVAAVDSEGRVFVKDSDLADKSFMPVLNQWGGDSPQWIRKDAWTNWDSTKQANYKIERSSEVIGATKSVDDAGKRVYLIAVRERESSPDNKDYVENIRWVIYKVYPKIPVQVQKITTDPLYEAAYKAFTDAIAAGKTNLAAFDEAAKAAKVVATEDGLTEAAIDKQIQVAKTEFTNSLNNGLSAVEAFEKIFSDDSTASVATSSGTAIAGYPVGTGSAIYAPGSGAPSANLPDNALLFSYSQENLKSITDKESLFAQDLNGDGTIGLNLDNLKLISSDTSGIRLARESGGAIYIVDVDAKNKITNFKAITGNDWLENSYYQGADNYNKREAFAVIAIREGLNITGYKLLLRSESKWGGQSKPQVTWDIYNLDKDAKVTWGHWDSTKNQWVNDSEYGLTSIKSYETTFGQDLDGDGKMGVSLEDLIFEPRDTNGERLGRDSAKALYIVDSKDEMLDIKNASWLEYNNSWGWGSSESKKAIAVQADEKGNGYWLALERTSKWGENATSTTSYDIVKIDTTGKVTWGYWDSTANKWVDESQYNLSSLTAYEKIFKEDFNGDGFVGIDPKTLVWDTRDTTGVRLGRDKDKAIYVVTVAADGVTATDAVDIKGTSWLEYDSGWGYKREAVAVEEAEGGGYWLALKNTSNYWDYQTSTSKPQITWDIYKLDDTARLATGQYVNNQWTDETVYGAKSIAAYEELFDQDLNGDGIVGLDLSKLKMVETDSTGVRLARSDDGGLYFVTQYGTADQKIKAIKDGWLEYDYSSGDSVNRREAVAIEQKDDVLILALKNTSTQWNGTQHETKTSWDVMHISATGKLLYGYWNSSTNQWVEQSSWGVSIADYEIDFDLDLNGDGVKGIDISKLTPVNTDHSDASGVRIYRDNDRVLYIVNANQATPIKNSTWMEYKYAWGESSNSRTAVAAEQVSVDNAGKPVYKVLFQYESKWSGGGDTNWEVITVDSTGRQLWSEGTSVWTRNTKVVETMFSEDLNNDNLIGPNPDDLQNVSTDTSNPFLKMDKTDQTLYVIDGTKKTPVIDRYGSPTSLTRDVDWGGVMIKYRPHAVSKIVVNGDVTGYHLLVKVDKEGSSVSSWEIYTVSTQGVIDLYNIKTTKFIDRYEVEFDQELDGVPGIGVAAVSLTSEPTDTGNTILGRQMSGSDVMGLYAQVGGKQILLTNKNGGFPSIEYTREGQTAKVVATDKLDLGAGKFAIKVAVKNEVSVGDSKDVSWDVYHFNLNAAGEEAVLDRAKTLRFDQDAVKSVEILVNQNLEVGDTTIGYPLAKPVAAQVELGAELSKDVGSVKAGVDASSGWLYVMLADKNLPVLDVAGNNVTLGSTLTYQEQQNGYDTVVTIHEEVFAGTAVYTTGASSSKVLNSYKVLVREKTSSEWTDTGGVKQSSDSLLWKLYTVDTNGVIDSNYASSVTPNRWAAIFGEDVDKDGAVLGDLEVQNFGVAIEDPKVLRGFKEIRSSGDDFFLKDTLKDSDKFVPILLENQSSIDFEFKTPLGNGELKSEIKYIATSESVKDEFYLAVERTYIEGIDANASYMVYTLDIKEDPLTQQRYAEVQSADTYVTDDLTTFKEGNKAVFAGLESVS